MMWGVSPFLVKQLETEGVRVLEILWDLDEDNIEDYENDYGIKLSENLLFNADDISSEGIDPNEPGNIEIQGFFAKFIHWVLTGNEDANTLSGEKVSDFTVREEVISEKSWSLVNALVGTKRVKDAEDYVASYLSPVETKNISLALAKIGGEDFEVRCKTFFSASKERRFVVAGTEIHNQRQYMQMTDVIDISDVEEFVQSELIPLYSKASEMGYGILIAWSI
jgi:hypothetical protein